MMPVHDQASAGGSGEFVEDGEAVAVHGRSLMRHQDVKAFPAQAVDVLREDRVAMPKRQTATPMFVRSQRREKLHPGPKTRRVDPGSGFVGPRVPDPGLEHARQTRDPYSGNLGDAQPEVTVGMGPDQMVVALLGFGVVIAEDPFHLPSGPQNGRQDRWQRFRAIAIAHQNQCAGVQGQASPQNR